MLVREVLGGLAIEHRLELLLEVFVVIVQIGLMQVHYLIKSELFVATCSTVDLNY